MSTVLSIDIGGSQFGVAFVRLNPLRREASILCKVARPLSSDCDANRLIDAVDEAIAELLADPASPEDFQSIGVAIPGLADPRHGLWVYACFSGIRNLPIAEILSRKFDLPVFIENDVNACALAEHRFGCCRDTDDFLWITVSNGIGGGLVLGGRILRGHFGNAGEIGHFHVVDDGRPCGCGNSGCLEAEAAGPGIAHYYAVLKSGHFRHEDVLRHSAREIAQLARQGEKEALATWARTGHLLGRVTALAANLVNPGKIVFGGGVSQSFDLFYPALRETFDRECFRDACRDVVIEPTALGTDAASFGAAALCVEPE